MVWKIAPQNFEDVLSTIDNQIEESKNLIANKRQRQEKGLHQDIFKEERGGTGKEGREEQKREVEREREGGRG